MKHASIVYQFHSIYVRLVNSWIAIVVCVFGCVVRFETYGYFAHGGRGMTAAAHAHVHVYDGKKLIGRDEMGICGVG